MKKASVSVRTFAVIVSTLLFLALGVLNIAERTSQPPLADDGVIWRPSPLGLQAKQVRRASAAERAGIVPGDVLRAILLPDADGRAAPEPLQVSDDWEVQYCLDEKIKIGGSATYLIERFNSFGVSKDLWEADLRDIPPQPSRFWLDLYLGFVGLIYLIIGLIVFAKHEKTNQSIHFFIVCLLSFLYLFYSPSGSFSGFDQLILLLDNSALIMLCPAFLHFCAVFPHRSEWIDRNRWSLRLLYLPGGMLALLEAAHLFLGNYSQAILSIRPFLTEAAIIHFTGYFIASAGIVFVTFTQAQIPLLRQQIKWIVWGLTLGIAPWTVCYAVPFVFGLERTPLMEALAIGPTIFVPLAFGYSIVRYRLMDVDVIVRRSATYAIATSSVVMLFMLGVVKSADWIGETLPTAPGAATTALQVIVLSCGVLAFPPLKNWLQERIDRIFYGARYENRRGVADFGHTVAATTALPELLDAIADRLTKILSVQELAIFIADERPDDGQRDLFLSVVSAPERVNAFRVALSRGLLDEPAIPSDALAQLESGARFSYVTMENFLGIGGDISYYFPCVARERLVAVIGLGRTVSRTLLTSEDVELVRELTPYVAVAIENSLLYQRERERLREISTLKEFNENIIESINVGILAVDLQGRITTWNNALEEIFDIPSSTAEGRPIDEIFDKDLVRTMQEVTGGQGWSLRDVRQIYRCRTVGRNGQLRVVNISLSPLETRDAAVAGALICFEDLTSRVRLEEQLREADKLSSIGLLAAGVAHEVNTPLTGISSYTQMLLTQVKEGDPKHAVLEKIQRQTIRASDIVNNLLNFSRTGNSVFSELDMTRLLDDTLQLLEPQLNNTRIEVVRDYRRKLPKIAGHAGKLQQVFMNLILNARDAMPKGGTLHISAQSEDGNLIVNVADTGTGISPEYITKIYDPFFTTKDVGRGTGLGLAVSYGIIQEHAGHIFVESEPGCGTCFSIKLPCLKYNRKQAIGA
jgi:two-component system, NtrC family, sensor kinase